MDFFVQKPGDFSRNREISRFFKNCLQVVSLLVQYPHQKGAFNHFFIPVYILLYSKSLDLGIMRVLHLMGLHVHYLQTRMLKNTLYWWKQRFFDMTGNETYSSFHFSKFIRTLLRRTCVLLRGDFCNSTANVFSMLIVVVSSRVRLFSQPFWNYARWINFYF